MIRKAYTSSVVSITLRAIGSSSATPKGTILATGLRRHGSVNQSHNFCSLTTAKDLVDTSLYKALKNEIKYAKSELKNQVIIPRESFPFQIEEDSDIRTLILTRKLPDDEGIRVEIDTFCLNIEEEFESDDDFSSSDHDSSENDNDISLDKKRDGNEKGSNEDYIESKSETKLEGDFHDRQVPAIPMTVSIWKRGGYLNFEITVSSEDIVIEDMSVSEDSTKHRVFDVDGPKFKEMDFELQRSFYKYLENIGIKVDIARYLYQYIAKLKKKHHLLSLKHLKKVIKH